MKTFQHLYRFLIRFRYPVTLPEEIADALGISISNNLNFEELISRLTCQTCRPTRLCKFMPRNQAEAAFRSAQRKERFKNNSLYSYYFNEGWMEFVLQFDDDSRLRRIYIQHKTIQEERGIEIQLDKGLEFELDNSLREVLS